MDNYIFYYIYDKKLIEASKHIPNIGNRAAVVQSLIATYELFSKCKLCSSEEATDEDLLSFHTNDYLNCLKKAQKSSDLEKMTDSSEITDFNLGYDCPLFENIYEFAKLIAGSSLTAAKLLVNQNFKLKRKIQSNDINSKPKSYLKYKNGSKMNTGKSVYDADFSFEEDVNDDNLCNNDVRNHYKRIITEVSAVDSNVVPVAINWFGGWHHAQRDEAGGFCYVNDIVIAIQYLLKFYKRILYIDLDIHHGDGVENAFQFSQRVFTFSLHKFEPGFYPASGGVEEVGKGNGMYHAVNVPLKSGITDEKYVNLFIKIAEIIMEKYKPYCVVVQCGADCLAGDPLGGFNLTSEAIGRCLKFVLDKRLPTLILGGGGYNVANTARCWAYLTSLILNSPISNDIPENSFLHLYGPEYELGITPSLRKDENSNEYIESVLTKILSNLENISPNIRQVRSSPMLLPLLDVTDQNLLIITQQFNISFFLHGFVILLHIIICQYISSDCLGPPV